MRVEFRARGGALGTTPLAVQAAPIVFRIRTRTAAEENEVKEIEAMWQTRLGLTWSRACLLDIGANSSR